jgi:hypothetical protein
VTTAGSDTHDRATLAADAREFAATLEDAHPDPYAGHGGRVAFHRRLEELITGIPGDGESCSRFARRLRGFAARVRDGHTQVGVPDDEEDDVDGRLPLDCRVVGDALYVEAVYDDAHTGLLGGRLRAVDGVPVPDLRERVARTQSSDNQYGDRKRLCDALGPDPASLSALVDGDATSPTVTVETSAGERADRELSLLARDSPVSTLHTAIDHPETNGEPAYRFRDGDAALLTIPDCQTHREPLEAARAMYDDGPDLYDLRETYRQVVGEPVPEDDDAVLAGIPAATEIFAALAEAMAERGTETLVVDVRGNGGGSSLAAYALTYVLHGRDGIAAAAGDQYSVSKDSALYRENYGEDGPLDGGDNPAGFDFDAYFTPTEEKGAYVLEELTGLSETFAAEVERRGDAGVYCPENVVVVTDAETFSAGLEPAVLLSKLGAQVVGVPSAQAANGPRDVLQGELSNTGLGFRVSYRHHVFQPGEDGTVFAPDVALTPERFEEYDRASDAGVRLALDAVTGTSGL